MSTERLELKIAELVRRFQADPFHYFSERELHGEFFGLCRVEFGMVKPLGEECAIPLFRHEYNTFWRLRRDKRGTSFEVRSSTDGVAGSLDFAILNADFVRANDLLTVINKHEPRRALRRDMASTALDHAIEFKMAHIREAKIVSQRALKDLRTGIMEDCRKLAHAEPRQAFMLAFSHPDGPALGDAEFTLRQGLAEFTRIRQRGQRGQCGSLAILLATPTHTYVSGDWMNVSGFPNSRPVSRA